MRPGGLHLPEGVLSPCTSGRLIHSQSSSHLRPFSSSSEIPTAPFPSPLGRVSAPNSGVPTRVPPPPSMQVSFPGSRGCFHHSPLPRFLKAANPRLVGPRVLLTLPLKYLCLSPMCVSFPDHSHGPYLASHFHSCSPICPSHIGQSHLEKCRCEMSHEFRGGGPSSLDQPSL